MTSKNIINVSIGDFNQVVEKSAVPVLVDFWAPWCGPCRAIAPILEQIAAKYTDKLKIAKINVDEEPSLASRFGIMSIPTLMIFKGGLIVKQVVGLRSAEDLDEMISSIL